MHTSQLLVLGNGFDLHCGLKSSYKDFFQSTILDTIGEHYGSRQMKAGVSGFWETLLFGYYKIHSGNTDYNWCDIETIIKDTLLTFLNQCNRREQRLSVALFCYLFLLCALHCLQKSILFNKFFLFVML